LISAWLFLPAGFRSSLANENLFWDFIGIILASKVLLSVGVAGDLLLLEAGGFLGVMPTERKAEPGDEV
jgi:hypothetical protein